LQTAKQAKRENLKKREKDHNEAMYGTAPSNMRPTNTVPAALLHAGLEERQQVQVLLAA
jgi:hypothetical protein